MAVHPTALLQEARQLLRRILANGPLAVGLAIEAATRGLDGDLESGLALESTFFGLLAGSEDAPEGMRAFLEKRAAKFEGK